MRTFYPAWVPLLYLTGITQVTASGMSAAGPDPHHWGVPHYHNETVQCTVHCTVHVYRCTDPHHWGVSHYSVQYSVKYMCTGVQTHITEESHIILMKLLYRCTVQCTLHVYRCTVPHHGGVSHYPNETIWCNDINCLIVRVHVSELSWAGVTGCNPYI